MQHLGPEPRQRDLAHGGGGLAVFELQRAMGEAENAAPERDGARGHDQHIGAAAMKRGDVVGEARQPAMFRRSLLRIDEQRGADLDDDAFEVGEDGSALGHASGAKCPRDRAFASAA